MPREVRLWMVETTTREATQSPEPELETLGEELQEAESGRSVATPAWMLLAVVAVVAGLFLVAVTLVSLAYLLL